MVAVTFVDRELVEVKKAAMVSKRHQNLFILNKIHTIQILKLPRNEKPNGTLFSMYKTGM
ncbi:MAG: hypothetical protein MJE68_16780 [Proteobacteria bacterium]|nr:hypothetical protein [Pseudomonadota bacterium]